MKKYYLISILLTILLTISIPNFADEISFSIFCEISTTTCPIFDKNDPDFETQISNYTYNTMISSFGRPTITSVVPIKVPRGSTVDLLINGQNANFAKFSNIIIDDKITVNDGGGLISDNQMIVNVTISPKARIGFYDIEIISSNGESAIGKNVLQIIKASGNPEIVSITPTVIPKASTDLDILIYGLNTNFDDSSIIDFNDAGINTEIQEIYSSNFISALINVDENAYSGIHNITVETNDEIAKNIQLGILQIVQKDSSKTFEIIDFEDELIENIESDTTTDSNGVNLEENQDNNIILKEEHDDEISSEEEYTDDTNLEEPHENDASSEEKHTDNINLEEFHEDDASSEEEYTDNINLEKFHEDDASSEEEYTDNTNLEEFHEDDASSEEYGGITEEHDVIIDNLKTKITTELPFITNTANAPKCTITDKEINLVCKFNNNETIGNLSIGKRGSVSGGVLTGIMENHGMISIDIARSGILIGGIVTGYIKNEGIMANFEFRGASIEGGFLGGNIFNNSPINGHFEDIYLESGTHIIGGKLSGYIIGKPKQKAVLESLIINKGSFLKNVIIGKEVKIIGTVKIDESVEYIR